jgi:hypothetical protein
MRTCLVKNILYQKLNLALKTKTIIQNKTRKIKVNILQKKKNNSYILKMADN